MLKNFYWIFFDFKECENHKNINPDTLLKSNIIFSAQVVDYARKDYVNTGLWPVVATISLTPEIEKKVKPLFYQNHRKCSIITYFSEEIEVSPSDCIGLERLATWLPHNIVKRLNNYYSGKSYEEDDIYKLRL